MVYVCYILMIFTFFLLVGVLGFEGLLRCGKSCRLRWINYLRADLKRGNISAEEEELIVKLHASLGNRLAQLLYAPRLHFFFKPFFLNDKTKVRVHLLLH